MSFGHNCQFRSSQCNIWEIMEILMNILASFFIQPLFCALNFYSKFDEIFSKLWYFVGIVLNKFTQPLTKTTAFSFFSYKNRICHHKFKLDARNNGWTKKEAKIFIRISMIFQILHGLDRNRQLWPKVI